MVIREAELLATLRRAVVDQRGGLRLGLQWSDDEILRIFSERIRQSALEFGRRGHLHVIASLIDYCALGVNTLSYDAALGVTAHWFLPTDCVYLLSVGISGRNIPVYNLANSDSGAIDHLVEEVKTPSAFFLIVNGQPVLRLTESAASPLLDSGQHLVLMYIREFPTLQPGFVQYRFPVSIVLYTRAFIDTLSTLLEPDSGYTQLPYSPALSPHAQVGLWGSLDDIASANGKLKNLPPIVAR